MWILLVLWLIISLVCSGILLAACVISGRIASFEEYLPAFSTKATKAQQRLPPVRTRMSISQ